MCLRLGSTFSPPAIRVRTWCDRIGARPSQPSVSSFWRRRRQCDSCDWIRSAVKPRHRTRGYASTGAEIRLEILRLCTPPTTATCRHVVECARATETLGSPAIACRSVGLDPRLVGAMKQPLKLTEVGPPADPLTIVRPIDIERTNGTV
jgi:hypothetical protein